ADVPLPFLLFVVVVIADRGLSIMATMTTTTANGLATSAAEHEFDNLILDSAPGSTPGMYCR
ncbi:MAG TPA: hypothetical protein DDY14_17835, partial [Chromatiaceae bacterium]|nr:hypothetical protein [Chromatiaceae bacterium]